MKSEIKIGLLGIASLLILIFGYKFLKGKNLLERSQTFYVKYQDIDQLAVSNPVLINGLKVGSVLDLKIDPQDANFIIVTLDITGDLKFPKNTKAVLLSKGVLGDKIIELEFDKLCESNCLESGTFIEGTTKGFLSSMIGEPEDVNEYVDAISEKLSADEDLAQTMKNIEETVANLNKVTAQLDGLLSTSSSSLSGVISNVDQITRELAVNRKTLTNSLSNIEDFTGQLKAANVGEIANNLNQTISSTDAMIDRFEGTLNETNQSLKSVKTVLASIEKGKGTAGRLIKDETLINNLERATQNLDFLLQDIRLNPKRYINISVFGKKQKEYEKPEEDPAFEN